MPIRPYTPDDFDALYAIEEVCFQPPFRFPRAHMRKLVRNPHAAVWIAQEETTQEQSTMAGFAIVAWTTQPPSTADPSTTLAYIETIEVLPGFRARGIGAQLLQQVEASARAASAASLWLHVDITNAEAIRLYERHGFQPRGTEDDFYFPGRGALIYCKPLASNPA